MDDLSLLVELSFKEAGCRCAPEAWRREDDGSLVGSFIG